MKQSKLTRKLSQIYLTLVPFIMFIVAFLVGHISYKIYLPIYAIHICIMISCAWILGANNIKTEDEEKKRQIIIALFLLAPFALLSILFGIGPPPQEHATYLATASEQQIRYMFLIIGGLLVAGGLSLLRESLKKAGENFYSVLGFSAIIIAIPLFIMNMTLISFMIEVFKIQSASGSEQMPEWYSPIRYQYVTIAVVEVALTYLATAAFAASLKSVGWLRKTASNIYIIISLLGVLSLALFTITLIGGFSFVLIPALPFIMPYLIGINLLKRSA